MRLFGWLVFAAGSVSLATFGVYTGGARILQFVGRHESHNEGNCRGRRIPLAERNQCAVAGDQAAAAREADERKARASKAAFLLANVKPLKDEFDWRLIEIATARPPITDFGAQLKFGADLHFRLFQIMRLFPDHPLSKLDGSIGPGEISGIIHREESMRDPPGAQDAMRELDKACQLPWTSQLPCAEAMQKWIVNLGFRSAESYVDRLVSHPVSPIAAQGK
jgi:hypothetical protein